MASAPESASRSLAFALRRHMHMGVDDCWRLAGWDLQWCTPTVERRHEIHAYKQFRKWLTGLDAGDPVRAEFVKILYNADVPQAVAADLGLSRPVSLDTSCLVGGGV